MLILCKQVWRELLSLVKAPRWHKLTPDGACSLKLKTEAFLSIFMPPHSASSCCTGSARQKKPHNLISTSLPTSANWDQLYAQLSSGGSTHGVTQGFATLPKLSWLFPEPSPIYWYFYSLQQHFHQQQMNERLCSAISASRYPPAHSRPSAGTSIQLTFATEVAASSFCLLECTVLQM